MATTLSEFIAQHFTALPFLKKAGATVAATQLEAGRQIGRLPVRTTQPDGGPIGRLPFRTVTPDGGFKPPVQGFSAPDASGNRAPHPTPPARLTRDITERGFRAIQNRSTPS